MPVRRFTPIMAVPSHHTYSSPRHDYDIDSSLQRADYLSHATLEDTWDAASRSRNKDKDLIRNVNSAIGDTHAIVNRPWHLQARTVRGVSLPPRPLSAQPAFEEPVVAAAPTAARWTRASSVQRRSGPPVYDDALLRARARSLDRGGSTVNWTGQHIDPMVAATQDLVAHRPARLRKDAVLLARARLDARNPNKQILNRAASEPRVFERGQQSQHTYFNVQYPESYKYMYRIPDAKEKAMQKYYHSHKGRFGPTSKPPRPSLAGFPQVYVPWNGPGPSNRSKAAIIGSKMEPDGARGSSKGPRSQFAKDKLREMHFDDLQRKYK